MLSEEFQKQMQNRGWKDDFDLASLLKGFPQTITLQKQDSGRYSAYAPYAKYGTLEGVETAEEVVARLWIQTQDYLNSSNKKKKK